MEPVPAKPQANESPLTRLTWSDVTNRLDDMVNLLEAASATSVIYGVPRGGAIVAGLLHLRSGIPITTDPDRANIIVDDIIDSGRTRARWEGREFFALVNKLGSDHEMGWVHFPWEEEPDKDAESIVTRLLEFVGEDPSREGLIETPGRVIKAWKERTAGMHEDPAEILGKKFATDSDAMVLVDQIEFWSTCEHHLLPFWGQAHIAYIPEGEVYGVSKLARVVDLYAQRLQIQERMAHQIATAIDVNIHNQGVAVLLEAKHSCMVCRGIKKQNSVMKSPSLRGLFKTDSAARAEFYALIKK
jgi:GTP cyclohydrolase I